MISFYTEQLAALANVYHHTNDALSACTKLFKLVEYSRELALQFFQ